MEPDFEFKHADGRRVILRRRDGESDDEYLERRRQVHEQHAAGKFAFELDDFMTIDRRSTTTDPTSAMLDMGLEPSDLPVRQPARVVRENDDE